MLRSTIFLTQSGLRHLVRYEMGLSNFPAKFHTWQKMLLPKEETKKPILELRTSSMTAVVCDGRVQPYKTAMLRKRDLLPLEVDPAKLANIKSHRPVASITEVTANGSPVEVLTPGGTRLHRVSAFNAFSVFSNNDQLKTIRSVKAEERIPSKSSFFKTLAHTKYIVPAVSDTKFQEKLLVLKELERLKELNIANNSKRAISQNKVMTRKGIDERKGSAKKYVAATEQFISMPWEWLHLVAHSLWGGASQNKDNLVAGSAYANTEMLFIENELKYLASIYPLGFKLSVKAHLVPKTHIAKNIEYIVSTDDFKIPLVFYTQTPNMPHINFVGYFKAIVAELVEQAKGVRKVGEVKGITSY